MESVFDIEKVNKAINDVFDLFAEQKLTVAESIQVARSVDAAFAAKYPEAYKVMAKEI